MQIHANLLKVSFFWSLECTIGKYLSSFHYNTIIDSIGVCSFIYSFEVLPCLLSYPSTWTSYQPSTMVNLGNKCYELGSFLGLETKISRLIVEWTDLHGHARLDSCFRTLGIEKPFLVINVKFSCFSNPKHVFWFINLPFDVGACMFILMLRIWCWWMTGAYSSFWPSLGLNFIHLESLVCFCNPRNLNAPCLFRCTWPLINICIHI